MDNTEQTILNAARKVFIQKGLTGARMQEIADEAGINKAMLHYYFRSKHKLFEEVLKNTIGDFIPKIGSVLNSNLSLKEKIEGSIQIYFDMLMKNPDLPPFIIGELNRDPQHILAVIGEFEEIKEISIAFKTSFSSSNKKSFNAIQYVTSVLGMIIFPFLATPILKNAIFGGDEQLTKKYLSDRREIVTSYALKLLEE